MLKLKFLETEYELPLEKTLQSLTGKQTLMLEDYLGGWDKFQTGGTINTRSVVVLVWLALHHAGRTATLDEIEDTPGLLFGDALKEVEDVPDAPLPGSEPTLSEADSSSSPETSAATGTQLSPVSTG